MVKFLHKLLGTLAGVFIGKLATALFRKAWQATTHDDEVPRPTDARRRWGEVLIAAALQGMIIALVKAVVDRGAAEGTRKLTGVWPGENGDEPEGRRESA